MKHNTSRTPLTSRGKFGRLLAATAIAVGISALQVGSAQAFTPDVQAQADHYFHCLGLLITDPAAHAKECLPNNIPNSNKSLSELSVDAPPPPKCGIDEYEEGGECYPIETGCEEYPYDKMYRTEELYCPLEY